MTPKHSKMFEHVKNVNIYSNYSFDTPFSFGTPCISEKSCTFKKKLQSLHFVGIIWYNNISLRKGGGEKFKSLPSLQPSPPAHYSILSIELYLKSSFRIKLKQWKKCAEQYITVELHLSGLECAGRNPGMQKSGQLINR